MAIYRQSYTKPVPVGARIDDDPRSGRVAKWYDRNGKARTARLNKRGDRIILDSNTYYVKYTDGAGKKRVLNTGCTTREAAETIQADLRRRSELVRAGIITTAEDAISVHRDTPIEVHADAYLKNLSLKASGRHVKNVTAKLHRISKECQMRTLRDLSNDTVVAWISERSKEGMGARTLNTYRSAISAFANWCLDTGRLMTHPLLKVPRADERRGVRHQRRALTEQEMGRLLVAARLRPIAEYGRGVTKTKPSDKRSNWSRTALTYESIHDAYQLGLDVLSKTPRARDRLQALGVERELIYRTLLYTGLRKGELASINLAQVDLESTSACLMLEAKDEKNGKGAVIYLRPALADDIGRYIDAVHASGRDGTPLFRVPKDLARIINRDFEAAGIAKRDGRDRVVDVHALRHTFGTQLCRAGVPLRTAQAAMRHSSPVLTANVYTDPALLDVAAAVDTLPVLEREASAPQL